MTAGIAQNIPNGQIIVGSRNAAVSTERANAVVVGLQRGVEGLLYFVYFYVTECKALEA